MDTSNQVVVTDRAFAQIARILDGEPPETFLRVTVSGGGCSGFQYGFDLTKERMDGDVMLSQDGASVAIDDMSLMYLSGSEIDYVDDLIGASFQIRNPNATSSCGCGTSFSL